MIEILLCGLAALCGLTLGGCIGLIAVMWRLTNQDHPAHHRVGAARAVRDVVNAR